MNFYKINHIQQILLSFIEEWESAAALDTHLASPYVQAEIAKLEGLIAAPLDLAEIPTIQGVES